MYGAVRTMVNISKSFSFSCGMIFVLTMSLQYAIFFNTTWDNNSMGTFVLKADCERVDQHFDAALQPPFINEQDDDTAIIISSGWTKSFPTLYFIKEVMDSLTHLRGLSLTTPIYIIVDGLGNDDPEKKNQLDQYVDMLYHEYHHSSRVHLWINVQNHHVGGTVFKVLHFLQDHYPNIRYIYYLQHDIKFIHAINHTAIHKTMEQNPGIDIVRFRLHGESSNTACTNHRNLTQPTEGAFLTTNNITLFHTKKYSDMNHYARMSYYVGMIDSLGMRKRFPEGPMMNRANEDCFMDGPWLYGTPSGGPNTILHMDGRQKLVPSMNTTPIN